MPFFSYNRILRNSGLSLGLSLLFFFSQSVGFAQSVDDDFEETPLTLLDLTPEGRLVVSNLAVAMVPSDVRSAASTGDYDATISANISAILSLLQSVSVNSRSFRTLPLASSSGLGLGSWIAQGFFEGGSSSQTTIDRSANYLYMLQRALYGQSGVPSADQALLPFLYSATGFTNLLVSPSEVASQILAVDFLDDLDSYLHGSDDWSGTWGMIYDSLYTLSQSFVTDPPSPYDGTTLYVQEGAINDVWREDGSNAASDGSALQVVDPLVAGEVRSLQSYLTDIRDAIDGLSGGSSGSFNITNVFDYASPGSDSITEGEFGLSSIGVNLRQSYGSLLTNRIPASIGAVHTNEIFALTNAAMAALPSLSGVQNFIQDSFSPFDAQNVGTGPEIRLFQSFSHDGITIPGMSIDLSDSRLSLLRERCNWLARFSYGLLFLVLTILRIRSFLDYVVAGFSSIYGGEIEASSSAEGFDA